MNLVKVIIVCIPVFLFADYTAHIHPPQWQLTIRVMFLLVSFKFFIYSKYKSLIRYMVYKYFFPILSEVFSLQYYLLSIFSLLPIQ